MRRPGTRASRAFAVLAHAVHHHQTLWERGAALADRPLEWDRLARRRFEVIDMTARLGHIAYGGTP